MGRSGKASERKERKERKDNAETLRARRFAENWQMGFEVELEYSRGDGIS